MFGMVLATGIRILSRCNYTTNRYNLYIVAISLGVGMTPTLSHDFFLSYRPYCNRCCIAALCSQPLAPLC
ncbi:solute carrier family 23 protein [Escherichia coli]